MAWVRLDDKRAISHKLLTAGFAARGLDEAAICWSAHQENDGFISDKDVTMLGVLHGCDDVDEHARTLVAVDRWARDGRRKGYVIRGFLDFNPSRAELEAKRAADRERKRKRAGVQADSVRNPDGGGVES